MSARVVEYGDEDEDIEMQDFYRNIFAFRGVAAESLERLAQGGRSKSDVIREALALEEVFQRAMAEGATVVIRSNNGQPEREIVRS